MPHAVKWLWMVRMSRCRRAPLVTSSMPGAFFVFSLPMVSLMVAGQKQGGAGSCRVGDASARATSSSMCAWWAGRSLGLGWQTLVGQYLRPFLGGEAQRPVWMT